MVSIDNDPESIHSAPDLDPENESSRTANNSRKQMQMEQAWSMFHDRLIVALSDLHAIIDRKEKVRIGEFGEEPVEESPLPGQFQELLIMFREAQEQYPFDVEVRKRLLPQFRLLTTFCDTMRSTRGGLRKIGIGTTARAARNDALTLLATMSRHFPSR